MSCLKRGWVMAVAPPLAACESVTDARDDQDRHPGQQAAGVRREGSRPRHLLIAQTLRRDACLPVGDPTDDFAHWLAPLRCGVSPLARFCLDARADLAPLFAG